MYRSVHAFIDVSDLQPKQGIKRLQSDCTLPPSSGRCKANVIADDNGCPDDSDRPVGAAAIAATDDRHRNIYSESDTQDTDDDVDENDDDADTVDDNNSDEENVSHWFRALDRLLLYEISVSDLPALCLPHADSNV